MKTAKLFQEIRASPIERISSRFLDLVTRPRCVTRRAVLDCGLTRSLALSNAERQFQRGTGGQRTSHSTACGQRCKMAKAFNEARKRHLPHRVSMEDVSLLERRATERRTTGQSKSRPGPGEAWRTDLSHCCVNGRTESGSHSRLRL